MNAPTPPTGGDWLADDAPPDRIFTPERMTEEHRLIRRTADEFVRQEVAPALDALERKDWATARRLLEQCGELGLLGVDVPEALGGVDLDKVSSLLVTDAIGAVASFSMAFGAQTGLTAMPILCFGTDDQRARYLPAIVSGKTIGAYCLSEAASGSDALGARARAMQQADGSWRLNGEKLWITNGGFADLFVVFAKVDGDRFTAFLVERGFPGVSSGSEEHKMGLLGSSTTPVLLNDAQVPAANVLGEIGRGHKVAFNVLNYGRLKLAAMCVGGARPALAEAIAHAKTRQQFGRPLASFGAIQQKLADMAARLYGVESALYRTASAIDAAMAAAGGGPETMAPACEAFAIEASILKVAASEMIDFVVDENVQIHGGNGFVRDYPAERRYRDARVNRIFEGTNEINRLLIPSLFARRAAGGTLSVARTAPAVARDARRDAASIGVWIDDAVAGLKTTASMLLQRAIDRMGDRLSGEQEMLSGIADVLIDTYVVESAALRAAQARDGGHALAATHTDAAAILADAACLRAVQHAHAVLPAIEGGEPAGRSIASIRELCDRPPLDVIAIRRRIAADLCH
jgi:alkylation response protein AidB-like acyl-CoA dehydrogenase